MNAAAHARNVVYLKDRRKKPARTPSLNYCDLASYCDSPERVGNVQVILRADYLRGFTMLVADDRKAIRVVDGSNRPHRFRTVEIAMDELIDVPFIDERIVIEWSRWKC
jgi:hypothetical protein